MVSLHFYHAVLCMLSEFINKIINIIINCCHKVWWWSTACNNINFYFKQLHLKFTTLPMKTCFKNVHSQRAQWCVKNAINPKLTNVNEHFDAARRVRSNNGGSVRPLHNARTRWQKLAPTFRCPGLWAVHTAQYSKNLYVSLSVVILHK